MLQALDLMQLDRAGRVAEHAAFPGSLDARFFVCFCERIADERPPGAKRLLEKILVVLLRDDGDAFGDKRRQPARVIEMRVGIDDVPIGLLGIVRLVSAITASPRASLCPPSSTT